MNESRLRELLEDVRAGALDCDQAIELLRSLPFDDLGFARVDGHRQIRCGYPEVIFCSGKTVEQIVRIAERIVEHGCDLLATRIAEDAAGALTGRFPDAVFHKEARIVLLKQSHRKRPAGRILVVSAGTSDIPVAEEARITAEAMDNDVDALHDVGVAGIHRLLHHHKAVMSASVLVVVAGMEGALASVVAGMVNRPVVAVPTSVGYGASFNGIAPLLTMLNSCAAGVAVVNIDNGFGAGYLAATINRTGEELARSQEPAENPEA